MPRRIRQCSTCGSRYVVSASTSIIATAVNNNNNSFCSTCKRRITTTTTTTTEAAAAVTTNFERLDDGSKENEQERRQQQQQQQQQQWLLPSMEKNKQNACLEGRQAEQHAQSLPCNDTTVDSPNIHKTPRSILEPKSPHREYKRPRQSQREEMIINNNCDKENHGGSSDDESSDSDSEDENLPLVDWLSSQKKKSEQKRKRQSLESSSLPLHSKAYSSVTSSPTIAAIAKIHSTTFAAQHNATTSSFDQTWSSSKSLFVTKSTTTSTIDHTPSSFNRQDSSASCTNQDTHGNMQPPTSTTIILLSDNEDDENENDILNYQAFPYKTSSHAQNDQRENNSHSDVLQTKEHTLSSPIILLSDDEENNHNDNKDDVNGKNVQDNRGNAKSKIDTRSNDNNQNDTDDDNDDNYNDDDNDHDVLHEFHQVLEQQHHPDTNNKDLMTCFICGKSLSHITKRGWKGRLYHIKQCSKKYGVRAQDIRNHDDFDLFVAPQRKQVDSKTNNATAANPYTKQQQPSNKNWHGGVNTAATKNVNNMLMAASKRQQQKPNAPEKPSIFSVLMAGARRATKIEKIEKEAATTQTKSFGGRGGGGGRGRGGGGRWSQFRHSNYPCPQYKKIPQTDFVCDGFQYANSTLTSNYFLTHFHSDHYGGINKGWNAGTIYCSLPTANLVHQQLGVDRKYLHPLPMMTPTIIASKAGKAVTVTLLNANHCPGAIMFLFEIGKRTILHVGDFRWNTPIMTAQPPLRPFCNGTRQLDDLFLDTTYCNEQYALPTQAQCIQEAVTTAVEEIEIAKSNNTRILLLFGAYTIGKEAVYMAVAERLRMKVYVDRRRHRILSALEWPKEKMTLLTTRPEETMLWVVPLGHVNMKKMPSYLTVQSRGFQREYDRVVGFRPTGWSHSKKSKDIGKVLTTNKRGKITVHSVPYSEHSSFPELVECLEILKPKRIVPTVSVSKSKEQVDLLLSHLRRKQDAAFAS